MMGDIGDSAGTQTQDLQNRNLTLYSTKLRSHGKDNTFAKLMLLFEITKYLCLFSVKKLQAGVGGRKVYFPEKGCHLGTNRSDNET